MANYGTHPRTKRILANLAATDGALPKIAMQVGLNDHEAKDAVQEGFLRMYWLDILTPSIARVQEPELRKSIQRLLKMHVRFAARDLLRKKIRDNGRTEGAECADLLEDATRELVITLIDLGGCAQTADEILSRQPGPFEAFTDQLFDLAGLDDREKRLAQYLRDKTDHSRDQDFDLRLKPDQISRLKHRMLDKILTLLYTGTRSSQEGAHR